MTTEVAGSLAIAFSCTLERGVPLAMGAGVGQEMDGVVLPTMAEQPGESVPPFEPLQVQLQGPVPLGGEFTVPLVQRPVTGATGKLPPFEGPHTPGTAPDRTEAEQFAVVPPFKPAQVQIQGPSPPATELAVVLFAQIPVVGATGKLPLFELPH